MKFQPLRLAIISSIVVCIAAIAISIFIIKDGGVEHNPETQVVNSYSYTEDKYAQHQYLIVSTGGKYTLASLDGERISEELYDVLSLADYGLFYFKQGAKQGFIGENLNKIFETEAIIATNVSEGFVIYSLNGKKGYINITTGEKIDAVYEAAYDFSEGLAAVQIGGATGFINTEGRLVIPCEYSNNAIYQFKSGLCNVMTGSRSDGTLKAFYINTTGAKMFAQEYDYCLPFSEERAFVCVNREWHIIDSKGSRVGEHVFGPYEKTVPAVFKEGRAVVVKDGKYGIVDSDGEYVVEPKYEQISEITEGGAVFKENGLYGYMKSNGSVIITARYESLGNFKNGLAVFSVDHKYGVADRAATVVVNPEYEKITILDNGLIKISVSESEYYYVDKYGRLIYENTDKDNAA